MSHNSKPRAGPQLDSDEDPIATFQGVDVAVVLPTLNEEGGLALTLADIPFNALRRGGRTVRPLVIDGGSTDRTLEVAHERGVFVLHQRARGKGSAIREALEWLAGHGVPYAVVLDADFTYPGTAIPAVVELLEAGTQLVVGVREPEKSPKDDPRELVHRIGNRILNITASQLAGLPFLDLCSGFWGVRVPSVPSLNLVTDGFEIEAELFAKAYRAGYTVTQIPISYRERIGVAKLHAVRDGARILLSTIKFGRRQLSTAFSFPSSSQLRDLLSLAVVSGGEEFRLVVDASRRAEAEEIAARIRAGRPQSKLVIQLVPQGEGRTEALVQETGKARAPRTTTILLPALLGEATGESAYALVHLPRTDRLVALRPQSASPSTTADLARSGGFLVGPEGFHVEYAPDGWRAIERARAVYANTFPDAAAKELAFLGANGHYGTLMVFRPNTGADLRAPPAHPAPAGRSDSASSDPRSAAIVGKGLF